MVFQISWWSPSRLFGLSIPISTNVLMCLIGALVGTLIGVLPGIGPVATIAMLLPITFGLPPVGALIMLAGIYYGAQYGGSTTVDPGQHAGRGVVGRDRARRPPDGASRAAPARRSRSPRIGSFFAGCVATVLIAALGAPLTQARARSSARPNISR